MAITVNHSTPADGTFSAAGALAWDANHTLSGLGTMAEQNANNVAITGGSISVPTLAGTTSVTTPIVKATSSAGGALQNASGTNQLQWGAGGGNNLSVDVAININPANAQVDLSPTGTGLVKINPATAGTMNNMVIGGTTPLAGTFTSLTATSGIGGGAF